MRQNSKKWVVDLVIGIVVLSCGQGLKPPTPIVSSISPAEGSSLGGTVVTLSGANFTGDTKISFGDTLCNDLVINSNTSATCTVPPHSPAFADITASEFHVSSVFYAAYNYLVSGWRFIDGGEAKGLNKDTTKSAAYIFLEDFNMKLYATWAEVFGSINQIRVAAYNESSALWSFVDGNGVTGLNKDINQDASESRLFSFNSKLYLCWTENNGVASQLRVAAYNSNDNFPSWSFIDGSGANGLNRNPAKDVSGCSFSSNNSSLYLAWSEVGGTNNQIRVAVYNGNDDSPSWSFIDGGGTNGLNYNTAKNAETPNLTTFNGKLYLAWGEQGPGNKTQIRSVVFNGNTSSPSWSFIDGGGAIGLNKNSTFNAYRPKILVSNSKLYAFWGEGGSAATLRVVVYNGDDNSPTWTFVDGGNGLNVSGAVVTLNAVEFNSKIHVTWDEIDTGGNLLRTVHSMRYNGDDTTPSWQLIDGEGKSSLNYSNQSNTSYPSFAVSNGNLYLGWSEAAGVSQVRATLAY